MAGECLPVPAQTSTNVTVRATLYKYTGMIDKWVGKLTANSCFVVNRIWWKLYPLERDMLQQTA